MQFVFSAWFETGCLSSTAPNQAIVLFSRLVCPADDRFGCNTEFVNSHRLLVLDGLGPPGLCGHCLTPVVNRRSR